MTGQIATFAWKVEKLRDRGLDFYAFGEEKTRSDKEKLHKQLVRKNFCFAWSQFQRRDVPEDFGFNASEFEKENLGLYPVKLFLGKHDDFAIRGPELDLGDLAYDNIHFWKTPKLLLPPAQPWEFIKIGNCGSPVESERGWLVLSHGVGAMRKYCLGAFLLDLEDPSRVIGRLREPLLSPNEAEREGYVPNVVYTCGALLQGREVIIPYAMSDSATSFATVSLDELLAAME